MDIAGLVRDEKAVSPVIGVVMMVAITVILSAVVGTFALGLGESQDTAPQSTWEKDYTDGSSDTLVLTHQSGDPMEADRLNVVATGVTCTSGTFDSPKNLNDDYGISTAVAAGNSVTIDGSQLCGGGNIDLSGATVRLVWEDEDTDDQADSATL
ncbi:MAG: type IV pilin N-terminal domain-containing protein, partial [Halobacteriales archaeon]|nr:type IV pilin N-terminal domain-containing protein [Halobacteriales archaeon]